MPLADVTAYPKLCKAYFVFFEILFRNHIQVVVALDTPVFMRVMHALHEGLQVRAGGRTWLVGCFRFFFFTLFCFLGLTPAVNHWLSTCGTSV